MATIQTYQEFLPALLRRTLAEYDMAADRDGSPGDLKPFSVPCYGAVLLADISGFTRLSSLMKAEELKLYINSFFSKILAVVEMFDGDVIKFCGDALLVVWPIDCDAAEAERCAVTTLATKCAVTFVSSPLLQNDLNLQLHCGISTGLIHCMHLGNQNQMEFLISGAAIQECGFAASEANLGQVCWSPATFELVQHKYVGSRKPLGSVLLVECSFFDMNCPECALYAGLYSSTQRPRAKKRSSPKVIRARSSSNSSAVSVRSLRPGCSPAAESPPYLSPLKDMPPSPLLSPNMSPRAAFSSLNSVDSLSPRATDVMLKGAASPERPNKIALPQLHSLSAGGSDSPGSRGRNLSGDSAYSPLRMASSANSSYGSQSRPAAGSPNKSQLSDSTPSSLFHHGESLTSEKSSMSVGSDPMEAELWLQTKRKSKSILDNIAESLEKVKSNFSSGEPSCSYSPTDEVSIRTNSSNSRRLNAVRASGRVLRSSTLVETAPQMDQPSALQRHSLSGRPGKGSATAFSSIISGDSISQNGQSETMPSPLVTVDSEEIHRLLHADERYHEAGARAYLAAHFGPTSYKYSEQSGKTSTSSGSQKLTHIEDNVETLGRKSTMYRLFVPTMAQFAQEEGLDSLAEMRRVTTIFIEVLDAEDDFLSGNVIKPQKAMRFILACLARFSGFLRQFVVDDKGCVAIIGFGVPGYCHDDNSARAIEAAVYIRRHLQSANMNCKIGIAAGKVYCGLVGSTYRCEYAMMGASVNLAARLMGKCCPGQILVEEQVRANTTKLFLFEELPKIKVKGYSLPLTFFVPICRNTGRSNIIGNYYYNSPVANIFIGRSFELAFFESVLASMASHAGKGKKKSSFELNAHVIEGPPGIGKSWLAEEVQCMSSKFMNISCCSATAAAPTAFDLMKYDIIGQLLEQLMGISAALGIDVQSRRLLGESGAETPSPSPSRGDSIFPMRTESTERHESISRGEINHDHKSVIMDHVECWFFGNFSSEFTLTLPEIPKKLSLVKLASNESLRDSASRSVRIAEEDDFDDEGTESIHHSITDVKMGEPTLRALDALALLNSVLSVTFPVSEAVAALSADERSRFREALLVQIFCHCIEKTPTLMVVSRIHWCDIASLKLLYQVLVRAKPVFICTVDPSAIIAEHNDIASTALFRGDILDPLSKILSMCRKHVLQPFTADEVESLLKGILGQGLLDMEPSVLDESSIQVMLARTAGNPYLLSALSIGIREAIAARSFTDIASIPYGRFDQSINNFDTLSRPAQFALKIASVIGMSFSELDLFQLTYELKFIAVAAELPALLVELQTREFVAVEESGNALCLSEIDQRSRNVYKFRSFSVYENVNNLLLEKQKERAHGAYAKILEPLLQHSPELLSILIHHYSESDNDKKKLDFFKLGLIHARTIFSASNVKKFALQLVKLMTGLETPELLLHACTSDVNAAATTYRHRSDSNPLVWLRKLHQKCVDKQKPICVRPMVDWLSAHNFVGPVIFERDTESLAGYIALESIVKFRRGLFRECQNDALLAMHYFGALHLLSFKISHVAGKWPFFGSRADSLKEFQKSSKFASLRKLNIFNVQLVMAICIQLGVINLLCGRTKALQFYFELAMTLRNFCDAHFVDNLHNFETARREAGFPVDYVLSLLKVKDLLLNLSSRCLSPVEASIKRKAISSGSPSIKTDYESTSAEWDLNDSMDDCSASLSRVRTTSSNLEGDYITDSKFITDAAAHISKAVSEAGNGQFALAYATFGWAVHSLNIDSDDFGATFRQMVILQNAWVALLSGNTDRSKVICRSVLEYARAFKQSLLCKWALELDMLHQFLSADFSLYSITSAIEHCINEIKNRTNSDVISPCSSAILGISFVMDRDPNRALPLIKYAISKLSKRHAVNFVPGIFLFIAGYAAALMMLHDNAYSRSLPTEFSIGYREMSPRVFLVCKDLVIQALGGLAMMASSAQPCLNLLYDSLNCKFFVATYEGTCNSQEAAKTFSDTNLSRYNEFVLAKAFAVLERLNFVVNVRLLKGGDFGQRQNELTMSSEFYFRKLSCPISSMTFFAGCKLRSPGEISVDSENSLSLSNSENPPLQSNGGNESLSIANRKDGRDDLSSSSPRSNRVVLGEACRDFDSPDSNIDDISPKSAVTGAGTPRVARNSSPFFPKDIIN